MDNKENELNRFIDIAAENEAFSLLSDKDIDIIRRINDTKKTIEYYPISQILYETSVKYQDKTALIAEGREYTYRELFKYIKSIAAMLQKQGISKEDTVVILMKKSMGQVAAAMGTIYAGVAYVPLEYECPVERIVFCAKNSKAMLIIADAAMKEKLQGHTACDVIDFDDIEISDGYSELKPVLTDKDNLYSVIFTSGSTGNPKGVQLENINVYNMIMCLKESYSLSYKDKLLSVTNICHDLCVFDFLSMLLFGGTLVLPDIDKNKEATHWLELLSKHEVTVWLSVPTIMRMLAYAMESDSDSGFVIDSLRIVQLGGEFVIPKDYEFVSRRMPSAKLYNIGCPTEATVINITHLVTEKDVIRGEVPYGSPIWNTQYFILDENLKVVPTGTEGIIFNSGLCITRGYIDDALTKERYIIHPELNVRMYNTGDLGLYNEDGFIMLRGRADNQVKINGKRIELEEIEKCIKACDEVSESIVTVADSNTAGKRLVAFVKLKNQSSFENSKVDSWKSVFDEVYENERKNHSSDFDFSGWHSSYTGQQIPDSEMLEWVMNTVKRIKALKGKKVLEIGCGTGLLLKEVAPSTEAFVGIDLSDTAIENLKLQLGEVPDKWAHVELYQGTADDLSCVAGRKFDAIIINSVIMFFPSGQYLTKVIRGCMELLNDGGKLFLGDVYDMRFMEMFRTSVRLFNQNEGSISDLKKTIYEDIINIKDLYVSQEYFEYLYHIIPDVSGISLNQKNAMDSNEMTKYRYDVVICKNCKFNRYIKEEFDYFEDRLDINVIKERVKNLEGELKIKNIPNKTLIYDSLAYTLLNECSDNMEVSTFKALLNERQYEGLYPAEIYAVAEELGCRCTVKNTGLNVFEVIFSSSEISNVNKGEKAGIHVDDLTNTIKHKDNTYAIENIVDKIKEKVPQYMIPGYWEFVEDFPVLPNGKIDRKTLIKNMCIKVVKNDIDNTNLSLKEQLVSIWRNLLQIENISEDKAFLSLGGNSLLAMQLLNELKNKYGINLRFIDFIEHSSVNEVAALVENYRKPNTPELYTYALMREPDKRYEPFMLNDMQQSYLLGRNDLYLGNVPTHMYLVFAVPDLEIERFNHAVNKLVKRHESLRCIICGEDKQVVLREVPEYMTEVFDWSGLSDEAAAEKIHSLRKRMAYEKTDMERFPAFDLCITKQKDNLYLIHVVLDSVMIDGMSIAILENDMIKLYKGEVLPQINISLRDYMISYEGYKKSAKYNSTKMYWLNRIDTLPDGPSLPVEGESAELFCPKVYRKTGFLHENIYGFIKKKALALNVSPTVVQIAVYALVLSKWSNSKHFTVNIPIFNKLPFVPEVNQLTGEFGSLIFLEIDLRDLKNFSEICFRVREQLYADLENKDVSGVEILREFERKGRTAVFPVVFTALTATDDRTLFRNECPIKEWMSQSSGVWIDMITNEQAGALEIAWDCYEGVISKDVIDEMFYAYCQMFNKLGKAAETWDNTLYELYEVQNLSLIKKYNNEMDLTFTHVPLLHHAFALQAKKAPDSISCITLNKALTYKELYYYSVDVALKLGRLAEDKPVAVFMDKSWQQIAGAMGVLFAGGAFLPVNISWPKERVMSILDEASVDTIITQGRYADDFCTTYGLKVITVAEELAHNKFFDEFKVSEKQSPNSLAYVIYTSGSTGTPKGVMIEHQSAVNTIRDINSRFETDEKDRAIALSDFCFDLSVYDIFGMLSVGGSLYIPDAKEKSDIGTWQDIVVDNGITVWNTVPAMMEMFMDFNCFGDVKFPFIRLVLLSGDWIPVTLPDKIRKVCCNARIVSLGGATEASIWSNYFYIDRVEKDWKSIPYGYPLYNQHLYIMNDAGEHNPVNVAGNICIGGIGLARGYLNQTGLTEEKFVMNPFVGERLYITGDIGKYRPDGSIEFLGRKDNQIKLNGYRIELAEIESNAMQIDGIMQAVAIVKKTHGVGSSIILFYTAADGLVSEDIKGYLKEKLPVYMIPAACVQLQSMPLNSNGKVNRNALAAMELEVKAAECIQYGDEIERCLFEICKDILNLSSIKNDDNFFLIGGNSVQAVKILSAIRQEYQVNISLGDMYNAPSIEKWHDLIAESIKSKIIVQYDKKAGLESVTDGRYPLSYAQLGMWYECMVNDSSQYLLNTSTEISGKLDVDRFNRAFEMTADTYDIIKTAIHLNDNFDPYQEVLRDRKVGLSYMDLTHAQDAGHELNLIMRESSSKVIDLEKDNLCDFKLVKLAEDHFKLIAVFHHIISDDLSVKLFINKLAENYHTASEAKGTAGVNCGISPITKKYFEHCLREKTEDSLNDEDKKWFGNLIENSGELVIPGSKKVVGETDYTSDQIEFDFEPHELEAFQKICAQNNCTLYLGFLAIYLIFLSKLTGESLISIGTPFSTRKNDEYEVMGLLINMNLIQTEITEKDTFGSVIIKIQKLILRYMERQYPPLSDIVRILKQPHEKALIPHGIVYNYLEKSDSKVNEQDIHFSDVNYFNTKAVHNFEFVIERYKGITKGQFLFNTGYIDKDEVVKYSDGFIKIFNSVVEEQKSGSFEGKR